MRVRLLLALVLCTAAACTKNSKTPSPPAVEAAEDGGEDGPKACASTDECEPGQRCTTDHGACSKPPGCQPGDICAQVCYGVCTSTVTTIPPPGACEKDEDCRAFSDYCTGCDCRPLSRQQLDPKCPGPGVRCVADPCLNRGAVCKSGKCALTDRAPAPAQ